METRLSLLLAVSSEDLAALLAAGLADAGLPAAYALAPTPGDFSRALIEEPWDVVVSEESVGGMHWKEVLALTRSWGPDTPFVLLLPEPSQDAALAALKAGANDVLCADDWRAPGVILRLLRESRTRRDRTERMDCLEQDKQTFQSMIDNSVLGIFRCAPWGSVTIFNPALARILGFDSAEDMDAALDRDRLLPGIDRQVLETLLFMVRTQHAVTDHETQVTRPDGSRVWISVNARAIVGPEGEISAIEGAVENIQKRKAMESMIIRAKQEWEKTFDSVPDIIAVLDADLHVRRMNMTLASRLGGHPRDLVGRPCSELLDPPDEAPEVSARIREMSGSQARTEELHIPALGGWFLVTVSPFFPDGDVDAGQDGYVLVAHDVSRRKDLELQLRRSQKLEAIGTLAGGIAHDFNNILGVMMGYTEMSLEDAPEHSPLSRRLDQVLAAGRRARDLVHQILTFSRQEEMDLQPLKLDTVVKEVAKLLRASLPAGVSIQLDLAPEAGAVLANLSQMHQVLMNLCTNAAHAMRENGGTLRIALREAEKDDQPPARRPNLGPGPFVRLTVADKGHGIPPELLDKVFDPFFTTKGPDEGTGMGLAMVHGIVTGHNGAIDVASEPGRGTCFTVHLPVCRQAPGPDRAAQEPGLLAGGRALFVDDEPELAAIGAEMLQSLGFSAEAATDPLAALALFQDKPEAFDLVVTDQSMPGLSGTDLAKRMLEAREDLAVVLCSGYSEGLSPDKTRALGIGAFLQKPFMRDDLTRAVRRALGED
ncbi:PAS domain-containing hybrid sensor histidine kinase/response regulator [Desulfocurvus sp. DL9XJH121]